MKGYLGTGFSFPVRIDPGTGRFETAKEAISVKQSLYLILMTGRGERLMRPSFGSDILSYAFDDLSITMLNMMKHELTALILRQEPRISKVDITVDPDAVKNALIINIDYMLQEGNTVDNLVFPFYLQTIKEDEVYEPFDSYELG